MPQSNAPGGASSIAVANTPAGVPAIAVSGVSKAYRGGPAGTAPALSTVNLQVQPGETVAIVGRSGSGKSTLINLISGIDRATQGEVHVAGAAVHALNESAMAVWRGRSLGVVFQFFHLLPTLTVLENVLLPMDFSRAPFHCGSGEAKAHELLATLGVAVHAHKFPQQLSGGEQQRVAVARALANDPPVIVADEPTGNLDSGNSAEVMRLLTGLARTRLASNRLATTEPTSAARRTVIVATHDQELLPLFSRVITLRDGRIVSDEPTATPHP